MFLWSLRPLVSWSKTPAAYIKIRRINLLRRPELSPVIASVKHFFQVGWENYGIQSVAPQVLNTFSLSKDENMHGRNITLLS